MGVKSTVGLTRKQAEERYVDLRLDAIVEEQRKLLLKHAQTIPSEELEDAIERMNDLAHGGEGYENYLISDAD